MYCFYGFKYYLCSTQIKNMKHIKTFIFTTSSPVMRCKDSKELSLVVYFFAGLFAFILTIINY